MQMTKQESWVLVDENYTVYGNAKTKLPFTSQTNAVRALKMMKAVRADNAVVFARKII